MNANVMGRAPMQWGYHSLKGYWTITITDSSEIIQLKNPYIKHLMTM